jgi:hypothetical protein
MMKMSRIALIIIDKTIEVSTVFCFKDFPKKEVRLYAAKVLFLAAVLTACNLVVLGVVESLP